MEELPIPLFFDPFAGICVYQPRINFKMWDNADTFGPRSVTRFQHDYTNLLAQSTGCLLVRTPNGEYDLYASAFVVKNFPQNSNVQLPNGSPVKAFLLTAGHVFNSPFFTDGTPFDLFFTLSPTLTAPDIDNYSKFRVQRVYQFDPFQDGTSQNDPLFNYPFMLPENVDLLAILENDPNHIPGQIANIDVFNELEFEAWNESRTVRDCIIVGYPSAPDKRGDFVGLWAPAAFNNPERKRQVTAMIPPNSGTQRAFSIGTVLESNDDCIAVRVSTWAGMAGSPLCIPSRNGPGKLVFCGVYNGGPVVPFESLISKILFKLQGANINVTMDDIPRVPNANSRAEHLMWMTTLQKFLEVMTRPYNGHINFIQRLTIPIREFLADATAAGMEVNHNLGTKGGARFTNITKGLAAILGGDPNPQKIDCKLPVWKGNQNFANADLERHVDAFWNNGIMRRTTTLWIFRTDAYALADKLISYLRVSQEKIRVNPNYPLAQIHRKFEKEILPRFHKIFHMWIAGLQGI